MKFANRLIAIVVFVFSTTSFSAKWETSQVYWSDDVGRTDDKIVGDFKTDIIDRALLVY